MSTKFAIRPAARKKPWICQRSPPCLDPPPFPPTLICTFAIQRRQPPPAQLLMQASFIIRHVGPGSRYNGKWQSGFDYFDAWFHYDTSTATGWAEAYWSAGPTSDHGNYPERIILLPPNLKYQAAEVKADNWDWWTHLLVTS